MRRWMRGVTIAGAGATLLSCVDDVPAAPTDEVLISAFDTHRGVFAALEADPSGAALPPAPEGLRRVTYPSAPGRLALVAWQEDIAGPGGCAKGYALLPDAPTDLVAALDGYECPGDALVYRRLEGQWYLYYSANN